MKSTLEKAIEHYGKDNQVIVAIEEMSELMKELSKNKRGEDNADHIAEEIADVEIMLKQLILIFDLQVEVEHYRIAKLERLAERLSNGN